MVMESLSAIRGMRTHDGGYVLMEAALASRLMSLTMVIAHWVSASRFWVVLYLLGHQCRLASMLLMQPFTLGRVSELQHSFLQSSAAGRRRDQLVRGAVLHWYSSASKGTSHKNR
jgi:hypothetical protein